MAEDCNPGDSSCVGPASDILCCATGLGGPAAGLSASAVEAMAAVCAAGADALFVIGQRQDAL